MSKVVKPTVMQSLMNIVNRAIAAFEGSDKDNLEKFYNGVIKDCQKKIDTKKRFISNEEIVHKNKLEELNESLEDAIDEVENAKVSISSDLLKSNADRASHISTFWSNVNNARRIVSKIEDNIQEELEAFKVLSERIALEIEQLESDVEDLKK